MTTTTPCRRRAAVAAALAALTLAGIAAAAEPRSESATDDATVTVKPTAPIRIGHRWLEAPAAGRPAVLAIDVSSRFELTDVEIRLSGSDALVVDAADRQQRLARLAPGQVHVFEPRVYVAVGGAHRLSVSVTAGIGPRRQTRILVLPVRTPGIQSGAGPDSDAGTLSVQRSAGAPGAAGGPSMPRVQSLPAVERIRDR